MSNLSASVSREEIEADIIFYSVLLSTLDPHSDDYIEKKSEYETALSDLEARLPLDDPPLTPLPSRSTYDNEATNGAFNLPSRESKGARVKPEHFSPLHSHHPPGLLYDNSASAAESGASSPSSAYSGLPKRSRDSIVVPASSKKPKRFSDAADASAATTPASNSSIDQNDDDDLLEPAGSFKYLSSNRAYILKKMQEQEKLMENRIKTEQQDRELARTMSTNHSFTAQPASAPATQSYFQPNGQWAKPKPEPVFSQPSFLPPARLPLIQPKMEFSSQTAATPYAPGPDTKAYSFPQTEPGYTLPGTFPTSELQNHNFTDAGNDDEDDDLQIISADQFAASTGSTETYAQSTQKYPEKLVPRLPAESKYMTFSQAPPQSQFGQNPPTNAPFGGYAQAADLGWRSLNFQPQLGIMSTYVNPQQITRQNFPYFSERRLERYKQMFQVQWDRAYTGSPDFREAHKQLYQLTKKIGSDHQEHQRRLNNSNANFPTTSSIASQLPSQNLMYQDPLAPGRQLPSSWMPLPNAQSVQKTDQLTPFDSNPQWYSSLGLPNPGMRMEATYTLEDDLHARGLDYMLADPTKTKEDLENLLANIRPDEDLPPEMRVGTPEQLKISLMEHQKLGLAWLQKQEEGSNKGGILADDMGLGKTIQALALIATRPSEDTACKTTLIIAPVSLLNQWKREIEQKMHRRHRLSVFVMHGAKTKDTRYPLLSTYDIVITTYGTVAAEYTRDLKYEERKKTNPNAARYPNERPVLLGEGCKWYRVILDEAQMIKNRNTKSALGCLYLFSKYRLCMTGTPMMNNVGELHSLIRFLRISPYNDQNKFNREIKRPIEGKYESEKKRAMKILQGLLKAILLRRTKKSEIDGKPILQLPERSTEVVHAVFDEDQAAFYKAIEDQAILQVSKYLEAGKIGRNYSYILVRLLRLRQACCHPLMIQDFAQNGPGDVSPEEMEELVKALSDEVVNRLKEANGQFECPVCFDAVENPTIFFPCGHDCCIDCFARITDPSNGVAEGEETTSAKCPECRNKLDDKKVFDYKAFKKLHLTANEEGDLLADDDNTVEGDSDSDSDSSSDLDNIDEDDSDDENDDTDSQGDLRDFIVPDDASIAQESDEDEGNEDDVAADGEHHEQDSRIKKARLKEPSGKDDKSTRQRGKKSKKEKKARKGKGKKEDKTKKLAELRKEGLKNAKAKRKYLRLLRKTWVTSAKVEKLREVLRNIGENDSNEKVIIFSQFSSFLDLLEIPIGDDGWRYVRYDGSMSAKDRNIAVEAFQDRREIKVMLVSLKAGNAGLNLTAASQVIIMDPFWNPFIEEQAIDRAHRIGQTRPVVVHRILVENTVEDRIIDLQEKKRAVINEALDQKAGQALSRLGRQELRYLFGISNSLPS